MRGISHSIVAKGSILFPPQYQPLVENRTNQEQIEAEGATKLRTMNLSKKFTSSYKKHRVPRPPWPCFGSQRISF